MSQPIGGTLAEIYLGGRAITSLFGTAALRYHPQCYYRPDEHSRTEIWPAIVASVTDLAGRQTGAHRTWLSPDGSGKAPVETPRRAMGDLFGHGVCFGVAGEVLAAGKDGWGEKHLVEGRGEGDKLELLRAVPAFL